MKLLYFSIGAISLTSSQALVIGKSIVLFTKPRIGN